MSKDPLASETALLSARGYYSNMRVWPHQPSTIDPRGWLGNFPDGADREIAGELLASFIFMNQQATSQLFQSAYHSISADVSKSSPSLSPLDRWREFRQQSVVTYPTGRDGDTAASGTIFIRYARDRLGIPQGQLCMSIGAIESACAAHSKNLIIVDDFAGTGDQFIGTWLRKDPTTGKSLRGLYNAEMFTTVWYVTAICTSHAKREILRTFPYIKVRSAHILPDEYRANPEYATTKLVPISMQPHLETFLERYADRAGYNIENIYGYGNLGLAICFEHSMPDCTLPIFWSNKSDWNPLRRRHDI